jgi:hypothetical protein
MNGRRSSNCGWTCGFDMETLKMYKRKTSTLHMRQKRITSELEGCQLNGEVVDISSHAKPR